MENYIWRILLIDDDEDDYFITRSILSEARQGTFLLEWANSYDRGREALRDRQYDAVLVDYDLHGHIGTELIREFSVAYPAPLIMVTGHGSVRVDQEALEAGASDYIAKAEINSAVLERSIRYAIERRKNQLNLQRERELLRRLFERIPIMISMYRPDLSMLDFNPALEKTLGWTTAEGRQAGEEMMARFYPDSDYRAQVTAFMQSLEEGWRDFEVTAKDGSRVPSSWSNIRLDDQTQIGIGVDLRERLRAEQSLRLSEERFRLATQALRGIVYDWDLHTNQVFRSAGMETVVGLPPQAANGSNTWWMDRIHPEDRPAIESIAEALRSGRQEHVVTEYRVRHHNGHWVTVRDQSLVMRDPDGKPARLLGVTTDVTDERRAEQDDRFLYQLSRAVAGLEDPRDLLQAVVERLGEYLGVDRCLVDILNPAAQTGQTLADYHPGLPSLQRAYAYTPPSAKLQEMIAEQQAIVIEDFSRLAAEPSENMQAVVPPDVSAYITIPDRSKKGLERCLSVASAQPRTWSPADVRLLKSVNDLLWRTFDKLELLVELRASEQRFQQALTAVDGIVWEYDLESGSVHRSSGLERILGIASSSLPPSQRAWEERIHPDDLVLPTHLSDLPVNAEGIYEGEYRVRHADGHWVWVQERGRVIVGPSGQPVRMVGTTTNIQRRKQAEFALRESEARFRRLSDSGVIGIILTTGSGEILTANDAFLSMIGYSRADLESGRLRWRELTPTEYLPLDEEHIREALAYGACMPYEKEYLHKDGRRISILIGYALMEGSRDEYICFVLDNTVRKRIERNARELAHLGDRLLGQVDPEVIFSLVTAEIGRHMDLRYCSMEEVDLQAGLIHYHHGYHRGGVFQTATIPLTTMPPAMANQLAAGEMVIIEDTEVDPRTAGSYATHFQPAGIRSLIILPRLLDGCWVSSFSISDEIVRHWAPDKLEFLASVANLAWLSIDHARTVQELTLAEERFRIALANTPVVVFTQDAELRYTWVHNPRVPYSQNEMLGKRDEDLLDPPSAAQLTAVKHEAIQNRQAVRREVKYLVAGEEVVYDLTVEPVIDETGQVTGITAAAMDITDLRRLEAERLERRAQLEVQRRLMEHREQERMGIARDLHDGPIQELMVANMQINSALLDLRDEHAQRLRGVETILKEQIGELRQFCQELRPPTLAPFGLERAIRSHADSFRERHPELAIKLELQRDGKRLSEDLRIALYRIYQELINNAFKHAHATQVRVRLLLDPGHVLLEVCDNGQGFTPPTDWVEQARSGHLGLVGMRERAMLQGGVLEIDSAPGQGACVRAIVPCAQTEFLGPALKSGS